MRADRLLSILLLMQTHRRLTAGALAERLEVSTRTIHRDMEALSMAGVPVYAERGAGGGWVLPDSFRTDVTGLTESEIQALLVSMPTRVLSDLGLERASDAALIKLLASMPGTSRRDAERARQRIHIDGAGWHQSEEAVPALAALQEAVWLDRKVRITYRRGDGTIVERVVDPLGLVAKGRLWYLVASVDGELRTYRVSRVQAVDLTSEPSIRPAEFDLAAFWAHSAAELVANLPRYPIVVRVAPEAVRRLWIPGAYARVEQVGQPEEDGWQRVHLTLQTEAEACSYALGFGALMEVVEPVALRERVVRTAGEIAAFYAEKSPKHSDLRVVLTDDRGHVGGDEAARPVMERSEGMAWVPEGQLSVSGSGS
jgi:predicted DNA-binding transcriptional regulator YafY